MITTETGVAGHWAGPVGLPQFTQANSRLVDGPSHRVEKGRHPSRLQPVLRHVIDGNAPVDDLVFRVELNQRQSGAFRFLRLVLDEGVDTAFGVFPSLLHGAASVDNQGDVGDVGFHGGFLSDGPGEPLDRKANRWV